MIIKYPYFTEEEIKQKGTNFALELYEKSESYDTTWVLLKIQQMATQGKVKEYAYILHDKDDAKPHYHICIKFNDQIRLQTVLNDLQLFNYNPNNNQVIIGKDRWYGALQYLIHNTKDSKDKYQYSEDDVKSNIPEIINGLRNQKDSIDIFNDIVDYIKSLDYPTYTAVIDYCNKHSRDYMKCFMSRSNNFIFSNIIKERSYH